MLSGRILGDFDARNAFLVLRSDVSADGNPLGDDGSFHFSDVEPKVCTLELMTRGKTLELDPCTFDMSLGSRRNVQVRVVAAKPGK